MARRPQQRNFLRIPQELLAHIRGLSLEDQQQAAVDFIHNSGADWHSLSVDDRLESYEAYIVHGPPGTGKTFVTAVGALLYLAKTDENPPQKQVAILTHTNAAADRVVEIFYSLFEQAGISPLTQRQLLIRVHARGYRSFNSIVQPFCTDADYDDTPEGRNRLVFDRSARIIVGTVFQPRRFQYHNLFLRGQLILDESSQLNPPLLTLGYFSLNPEVLGLIGDPNQLPPIVSLELLLTDAMSYYLGRSSNFRRRLPPHKYVMLDVQYRMHPVISGLVNTLGEFLTVPQDLLNDAPDTHNHILSNIYAESNFPFPLNPSIERIIDPEIPVILLDTTNFTQAEDVQAPGGSRFNLGEAQLASDLIHIFNRRYPGVEQKKAIIAPYSEQARIIGEGAATVDSFQGQEADLVILSMVRKSFDSQIGYSQIGFVSEINRLNVSLSRARCKLVIIMDIQTFQGAELYFRELINYCAGQYTGAITIQCDDGLAQTISETVRTLEEEGDSN